MSLKILISSAKQDSLIITNTTFNFPIELTVVWLQESELELNQDMNLGWRVMEVRLRNNLFSEYCLISLKKSINNEEALMGDCNVQLLGE